MSYFLNLSAGGVLQGALYAAIAVGLTMTYGLLRLVNFAHGELAMVGAYTTVILSGVWHVPAPVALVAAIAAVSLLGWILEVGVFRRAGRVELNGLIASVGLILVLQGAALLAFGPSPYRVDPPVRGVLTIGEFVMPWQRVVTVLVVVAALGGLGYFLRFTRQGVALRATGENVTAAALMGINVGRIRQASFVIGAAFAGLAGCLLAWLFPTTPVLGVQPVLMGFVVIVLGGLGSVPGALIAAFILGVVEALVVGYVTSAWVQAYAFAIMIIVLLVKPTGLLGRTHERT
jgi:branched-chain amino acid transport system permease protein